LGGARARTEIEVKDKSAAFAASGGDGFAVVLEFNLRPRKMAAKRSTKDFRRSKRRASASAEDIRGSIENS
jgi:hypothetical protein